MLISFDYYWITIESDYFLPAFLCINGWEFIRQGNEINVNDHVVEAIQCLPYQVIRRGD